jgi:hypothetical protein
MTRPFEGHVYSQNKEKVSSLYMQAKVRYSILANQRWFRVLVPWLLATSWLMYGAKQQHAVVRLKKIQLQFPSPSLENITHWCYLNRAGTGKMYRSSIHTPYAVEWFAGCWSWLEAHNQTNLQVARPAIAFDRGIYENFLVNPNFPEWNREFFHALQIPVLLQDDPPTEQPTFFTKPLGKETWFGDPRSCNSLRERLWKALNIQPRSATTSRRLDSTSSTGQQDTSRVHIGFVEGPARGLIVDSDQLAQNLQQHFPNTTVSYRTIEEDVALADQASWFAQQDIVIMAHGSGATNLIFMRPDTQLLELFPSNFFTEMYQTLAQQCGIHHDWYYDGGANPLQDMQDHFEEQGWRRNQKIHITLDQLKSRVEQMIVNMKQY